ncbi:MAG: hypothetical protein HY042_12870 [Spirochaetia bacterium]|nr:hypothetical protein [Spirochaetia bacterium]
MLAFLKRLFRKQKPQPPRRPSHEELDSRLDLILKELRLKQKRLLVTRSVTSGEIKAASGWKLSKTGTGLFRLDSDKASLLLFTEPFLLKKEGKITGMLGISESGLCRALGEGSLESILQVVEPVGGHSEELMRELRKGAPPAGEAALDASSLTDFDVSQLLAKSSLNVIAHVLMSGGELEKKVRKNLSVRLKEEIARELEGLTSPGTPGRRFYALLDFEEALAEFRARWRDYENEKLLRQMREEQRRSRQEHASTR